MTRENTEISSIFSHSLHSFPVLLHNCGFPRPCVFVERATIQSHAQLACTFYVYTCTFCFSGGEETGSTRRAASEEEGACHCRVYWQADGVFLDEAQVPESRLISNKTRRICN